MDRTRVALLGAVWLLGSATACKPKFQPTPLEPFEFCDSDSDCDEICLQNLCAPADAVVRECTLDLGAQCLGLPSMPRVVLPGVELSEGAAALAGNVLAIGRSVLGVDMFGYLSNVAAFPDPELLLVDASLVDVRAEPDRPRLVCSGFGYGLAWTDTQLEERSVWFGRLTPDGFRATTDVLIADEGREVDIIWGGDEFALAWTVPPSGSEPGVYLQRVDGVGFPLADPVRVDTRLSPGAAYPSLAYNGTDRFAVAWNDGSIVKLGIVDLSGTVLSVSELGDDADGIRAVQIAFNGDGYGIVWRNATTPRLRGTDADGNPDSDTFSIGNFGNPVSEHSLAWMGDRYWAAWPDPTLSPGAITITSMDVDGTVLDATAVSIPGGISASPPRLVAAGALAGVVFASEVRPGEPDPFDVFLDTTLCQ